MSSDEISHTSVVLILSTEALTKESPWLSIIRMLAKHSHISLFCSFASTKHTPTNNVVGVIDQSLRRLLLIYMNCYLSCHNPSWVWSNTISQLPGLKDHQSCMAVWHDISGNPARTSRASSECNLINNTNDQQLWYFNFKERKRFSSWVNIRSVGISSLQWWVTFTCTFIHRWGWDYDEGLYNRYFQKICST